MEKPTMNEAVSPIGKTVIFQQFVLRQFSRLHEAAKILAKREADLGVMWACGLTS